MCDAKQYFRCQENDRICQVDGQMNSSRGSDGLYIELQLVFTYKGSAILDPQSGYWGLRYTKLVTNTVAFVLFDVYDNYRIWRLSRHMIAFMQRLSLNPVQGSDKNPEEFVYILSLECETDSWRISQHCSSRSERRDQLDVF